MENVEQFKQVYALIAEFLVQYSFQVIGALIILAIGYWLAGRFAGFISNLLLKQNVDVTLSRFVGNSARAIVVVLVLIIALNNLGISVTPLIAAIGAVSLGAGLAVQGMLANYAAGFTIIITRPFVVGDTVAVQGELGVVEDVHLGYTILRDDDGVSIQIPNRHIVGEIIRNSETNTVVDLTVGISYASDPHAVIDLLYAALTADENLTLSTEPKLGIHGFGDSAIDLGVILSVPSMQVHQARFLANRIIYDTLQQNGISIPFPQREIKVLP